MDMMEIRRQMMGVIAGMATLRDGWKQMTVTIESNCSYVGDLIPNFTNNVPSFSSMVAVKDNVSSTSYEAVSVYGNNNIYRTISRVQSNGTDYGGIIVVDSYTVKATAGDTFTVFYKEA